MIRAVVFDYNGTIIDDTKMNEISWVETINIISNKQLNGKEIFYKNNGLRNNLMIEDVLKKSHLPINPEEIEKWSQYKETIYRKNCIKYQVKEMIKGCEELLNYLSERKYQLNLCTASIMENVNFYFDLLKLDRWFDRNKTIYDDGRFSNKEEMYAECFKINAIDPQDTLVFEDSLGSIKAAIKAGCKNIIAIRNIINKEEIIEVKQNIKDFSQLDYSIFE